MSIFEESRPNKKKKRKNKKNKKMSSDMGSVPDPKSGCFSYLGADWLASSYVKGLYRRSNGVCIAAAE